MSIYLAMNVTFKYITDARSYRHTNFTILLKRKANTRFNCTPTGSVDLSSDGVDVLINDIKEHLVKLKIINNLLREENQHLRGENIQNKNNLKVGKTNKASNVKVLQIKIKQNYRKQTETQLKILRKSTD